MCGIVMKTAEKKISLTDLQMNATCSTGASRWNCSDILHGFLGKQIWSVISDDIEFVNVLNWVLSYAWERFQKKLIKFIQTKLKNQNKPVIVTMEMKRSGHIGVRGILSNGMQLHAFETLKSATKPASAKRTLVKDNIFRWWDVNWNDVQINTIYKFICLHSHIFVLHLKTYQRHLK